MSEQDRAAALVHLQRLIDLDQNKQAWKELLVLLNEALAAQPAGKPPDEVPVTKIPITHTVKCHISTTSPSAESIGKHPFNNTDPQIPVPNAEPTPPVDVEGRITSALYNCADEMDQGGLSSKQEAAVENIQFTYAEGKSPRQEAVAAIRTAPLADGLQETLTPTERAAVLDFVKAVESETNMTRYIAKEIAKLFRALGIDK